MNGFIFGFSLQQKQFMRSIKIRQLVGVIRQFPHRFAHVGAAMAQNAEGYTRCATKKAATHKDAAIHYSTAESFSQPGSSTWVNLATS